MHDPFEITAGIKNAGADNIEHIYYVVHERDRYTALKRILDVNPDIFAIIFCRTRIETQEIAEKLIKDGYNADSLHGDLNQVQRDKVMKHYREKNLQLLVATDVAARGIDVNNVSHVINYQLPDEIEIYTHRSGRTARAGKSGITISIINTKDMGKLRYIEKHINKKLVYARVPGGVEVCEQQLLALMKRIRTVEINQPGIEKYLPAINSELKNIDKAELIARMVSLEFNRFLDYYRNAEDLNIDFSRKDHNRGRDNDKDAESIFINLGTIDGFNNARMLKYFKEITSLPPDAFKRINIKGVYSFVDVKSKYLAVFIEAFDNEVFKGRKVRVDSSERNKSKKTFSPGKRKNLKNSKSRQ
jgi:ATP-dependent RNA helicase DeaD